MDRLTQLNEDGNYISYVDEEKLAKMIIKLGQYEDTGVEPHEVGKVLHGQWRKGGSRAYKIVCKCTNCGALTQQFDTEKPIYRYCPFCGARMDDVK